MKPRLSATALAANTLVIVMIFCGVLSVLLVSSLALTQSSNLLDARSLCWNDALPTAEAGVEEAATHLRYSSANLQSDGWTNSGNQYSHTRVLDRGYYTVSLVPGNPVAPIQPTNPPVIYSTGCVQAPLVSGYIQRTVRATTRLIYYFDCGLLASKSISMGGLGTLVDSFDSSDPAKSTNGQYDPAKRLDNAHVGCLSSVPGCISVGNAKIYGDVSTKLGGTSTVGSSGSVGDKAFVNSPAGKGFIQAGHSFNNLNTNLANVQAPFTAGAAIPSGSLSGTNYAYLVGTGNYYYPGDLTLNNSQILMVAGDATVYITGSFSVNNGTALRIASGAKLKLYIGGPSATIGGGGAVNPSGYAANCSIFGLPTLTTGSYSGQAQFVGTIYAPQADWTFSGSADGFGAAVTYILHMTGGMNFHYDEALGSKGKPIYALNSWREL